MSYYIANIDDDVVICDDCGDSRWQNDPKYGTNVDARLDEAQETGYRWSWTPKWSSDGTTCADCGGHAK
jgi:hypothetical protein